MRWRCAFWLNKIAKAAGVPSEPAGRLSRWPYDYPAHQIFCEKQSLASLSGSMKKAIAGCRKAFGVLTEATGVDYSEPPDVSDIETHDIAIGESGETDSETGDATPLFGDPGMDDSWSEDEGTENFDGLQDDFDELEHEMAMGPSTSTKWGVQQTKPEPPSFSRITPAALHRLLGFEDDFTPSSPKAVKKTNKNKQRAGLASDGLLPLKGCPPPLVVYLEPGEMLYLPASWFHEVTSSSDDTGNENVHVAFN